MTHAVQECRSIVAGKQISEAVACSRNVCSTQATLIKSLKKGQPSQHVACESASGMEAVDIGNCGGII